MGNPSTAPTGPGDGSPSAAPPTPSPFLLTRAISFWCGNPAIERISGEIHYYLTPSSTSAARLLRQVRAAAAAARKARASSPHLADQAPMHSEAPLNATRAATVSVNGAGDASAGDVMAAATSAISGTGQSAGSTCQKLARQPRNGSVLRNLWLGTCSCGFAAEDWLQERCLLLAPRIPASLSPAEFCDFLSLRGGLVFEHAKVLHGPTTAEYLVLLYCTKYTALTAIAALGGRCLFVGDAYHAAPTCELRLVKHIQIYPPAAAPFSNTSNTTATDTYSTKGQKVDSAPTTLAPSHVPRSALNSRKSAASTGSCSEDLPGTRVESAEDKKNSKTRVVGVDSVDGSRRVAPDFVGDNNGSRAEGAETAAQARGGTDVKCLPATSACEAYRGRLSTCGAGRTNDISNGEDLHDTATKRPAVWEEATAQGIHLEPQRGSLSRAKNNSRGSSTSRGASPSSTRSKRVDRNYNDSNKGRSKSACRQLKNTTRSELGHALVPSRRGSSGLTPGIWAGDEAYWLLLRGQEEDAQQQQFCAVCLERVVIPVAPSLATTQYNMSSHLRAGDGSILSAAALSGAAPAASETAGEGKAAAVRKAATTRTADEEGARWRRKSDYRGNASFNDAACRFRTCSSRHRSTSNRRRRTTNRTCRSCSSSKSGKAEHGVSGSHRKCRTESSPGIAGAQDGDLVANIQAAAAATRSPVHREVAADVDSFSSGGHYSDSYDSSTSGAKDSHESSAVYDSTRCTRLDGSRFTGDCVSETNPSCNDGTIVDGGHNLSVSNGNGGVSNNTTSPGVVVTVLCGHSFHSSCLREWNDASCPVCRYQQHPHQPWLCFVCGSAEGVRVCLLCGFVGCGDVFSSMLPDGGAGANPAIANLVNSPASGSDVAEDADAADGDNCVPASAAADTPAAGPETAAPEKDVTALTRCTPPADGKTPAVEGCAEVEGGAAIRGADRAEVATEAAAVGASCMIAPAPAQMQCVAGLPVPGGLRAAVATTEEGLLLPVEKAEAHEVRCPNSCKDERTLLPSKEGKAEEDYGIQRGEKEGRTQERVAEESEGPGQDVREGDGALWMPFSSYSERRKLHPQHAQWQQGTSQRQIQQQQGQDQQHADDLGCLRKSAEAAAVERQQLAMKQPHQCERLPGSIRGHAQLHFEETLHTYALELETDRVWDFLSGGYVHFVVQERCHAKAALLQQKIKDEAAAADVCSSLPSSGNSGGKSLVFSYCSCCGGELFPAAASAELTVPTRDVGGVGGGALVRKDTGVEARAEGEAGESATATRRVEQSSQEEKRQLRYEAQAQGSEHEDPRQQLLKKQKEPQNLCGACRVIYAAVEVQPCEEQKSLLTNAAANTEDTDRVDAREQFEETTQQQHRQEFTPVLPALTGNRYTGVHTVSSAEPPVATLEGAVKGGTPVGVLLENTGRPLRDETDIHQSSLGETAGGTCRASCWQKVNGWITEFNQMLAASLDSQRDYYDEKIQRIVALYSRPVTECNEAAKEALQAVTVLQAQVKREGHALAALEIEAAALAAEGKKMAVRHTVLLRLHERLLQQAATARRLQEEEERRLGEAVQIRLAKIEDLQLQIREVSFHMQAVKQLAVVPGVEESTMLVAQRPAAPTKYSRGRGRRRHLNKVAPAQKPEKSEESSSSSSKHGTSSSACGDNYLASGSNDNSSTPSITHRCNTRGHTKSRRSRTRNSSGTMEINIIDTRSSQSEGGTKSNQTDSSSRCRCHTSGCNKSCEEEPRGIRTESSGASDDDGSRAAQK